ncbi:MAG TPA: prepilin-type N-terminal cleavage/methylation domain-containing protein [Candidatus Limnocylindria bacterium]|jgi:prepilin-type N-terminal cleavage/methylation domain-containing protein|nr:prepilin-type N-terminal cleavage/methylation domain-containing protein [Candidatus Limnocylindria bacterium]
MMIQAQRGQRSNHRGFTLVELLLTVSLITLLAGAVVFNLDSVTRSERLNESATMVESLLRYARAQASSRGREVVVLFGDAVANNGTGVSTASVATTTSTNASSAGVSSPTGVQVLWEPDPLGAPGKFEPLPGANTLTDQLNELVRVQEVRSPGADSSVASAANADTTATHEGGHSGMASAPASTATRPVKFFPDGSSDSVEIVLGSADDVDLRRLMVSLSGTTGTLRHRIFNVGPDGLPLTETESSGSPPEASAANQP